MRLGNPRTSNGNLRRKQRAWLKDQGLPCALCGKPIDYSLPAGDPMSFECDEVVPVSRYWMRLWNPQQQCWCGPYESPEAAALANENHQAAHRRCNQEKGNRVASAYEPAPILRSRVW